MIHEIAHSLGWYHEQSRPDRSTFILKNTAVYNITHQFNVTIYYLHVQKSTVIHEMGHSLGWYHEQSRPDRNSMVYVHGDRINSEEMHNFDKEEYASTIIPYDISSVMHYGKNVNIIFITYSCMGPFGTLD